VGWALSSGSAELIAAMVGGQTDGDHDELIAALSAGRFSH